VVSLHIRHIWPISFVSTNRERRNVKTHDKFSIPSSFQRDDLSTTLPSRNLPSFPGDVHFALLVSDPDHVRSIFRNGFIDPMVMGLIG
jgi:hypothetical protein